ncbi:MAG TPA: type II secretion system F family protein, partial [Bacillota bacterium]|nr:type II secretion system F family protein [Bacillota bacterium]
QIHRMRFSRQERLTFTQQLAGLLEAGIPLERALGILSKLKFSPNIGNTVIQLRRSLQEGLSFTMALQRFPDFFPEFYVNMVRAGEAGGILPEVLKRLAKYLEEEISLRRFIISSLFYPMILAVSSLIAIITYVAIVIPKFQSVFQGMDAELPAITKTVMFFGECLNNYWWLALIIIFGAMAWWLKEAHTQSGKMRIDSLKLKLPWIGPILQKIAISRMAFSLSLLYSSGVSLLNGLAIAGKIMGNACLSQALKKVEQEIKQGNTLAKGMATQGVFPVLAVEMIGVGEESGNLGTMLEQVATTYDNDVKHSLSIFMSLFEPILIFIMVGVIGVLAVAILLPVINMNTQMDGMG